MYSRVESGFRDVTGRSPRSAAERAYAYVKARLLDGRYAGGTLLSENEVARQLGISRTPVRQAFQQLEGEEMLELYPRRGALVRPIRSDEDEKVLEARLLLECHCVREVATADRRPASVLESILIEQDAALARGGEGFVDADRAFHRAVIAANGNEILVRWYDALRDRQQRITANAVASDPERMRRFINEHRAIAQAITAGDVSVAVDLTNAHLTGAHALARRR